jgi:hypothetical protein
MKCNEYPNEKPMKIKAYPISSIPLDRDVMVISKERSSIESCRPTIEDKDFYDYWAEIPEICYIDSIPDSPE